MSDSDETAQLGDDPTNTAPEPMSEEEIRAALSREVTEADPFAHGTIQQEQEKALNYYYARPFGNEIEGRSEVVLADVSETVDAIMPNLMRMFMGGTQVVRFDPNGPESVEEAKQKTDWCNYVFSRRLNGFMLLHDMFKAALIEKRGFGTVYSESYDEPEWESFTGMDEVMFDMLTSVEGVEVTQLRVNEHQEPVIDPQTQQPAMDPNTGAPMMRLTRTYDGEVKRVSKRSKVCVETFTGDEFLIAQRYPRLDSQTPFCARRFKTTVSRLTALGYDADKIATLTSDDPLDGNNIRRTRFLDEDNGTVQTPDRQGPAREVWVIEAFLRIDADGDGLTELHRIVAGGGSEGVGAILEDKRVPDNSYISLCPNPMPGKFWGRSLADLVVQLQEIRSTVLRGILDHLYLTVNPRSIIRDGAVELDDLLVSRPGGIVREYEPDSIRPWVTEPLTPSAFPTLEYLHDERENRSGVTRYNQGMDASSLNQTARGISAIMSAAQSRVELIARIFAEDLKRLFKLMVQCLADSGVQKEVIELRGEWIDFDPSLWKQDLTCTIQVGLGVGQAQERIANLQQVLQLQGQAQAAGLAPVMVKPKHAYNAMQRLVEAMGFPVEGMFIDDPKEWVPPPPPPPPEMVTAQAQADQVQSGTKVNSAKLMLEARKAQEEADLKQRELEARTMIDLERIRSNERIELAKLTTMKQTKARKPNGDARPEA